MRIARIDQAMDACEAHLTRTSAFGTEIENLLTRSLLVLICAEFEQKIEDLVQLRCSVVSDTAIREFVGSCVSAVFRSVKSSEISGLLNRFGASYKARFKSKLDSDPVAVTFYNNIVINRHGMAHAEGTNITFAEAKQFYEKGHCVLDWLDYALSNEETHGST